MRYFSKIAFLILYAADILIVYCMTENYIAAAAAAVIILLIPFFWQKINLFSTGAVSVDQYISRDAAVLKDAYASVLSRAERCGYKPGRAKLYISDQDTFNAYNCGNAIVVNRPVLQAPHLIEAILAHEQAHYNNYDSWFSMLLGINVTASGLLLSLTAGLYTIAVIVVLVIIISMFSKNAGWWGLYLGKALMPLQKFIVNVLVTVTIAFEMLISRSVEYEADRFAADIGYGAELKMFLSGCASSLKKPLTFTERLLSTHPIPARRIARIEKYEQRQLQRYY